MGNPVKHLVAFAAGRRTLTRCGINATSDDVTVWIDDTDCVDCLTGPYLGDPQPPTHGAREKAWWRTLR